MDPHLEGRFLGVEKAFIKKYNEEIAVDQGTVQNQDDFKAKVFESFVCEKDILLGYIKDILHFTENGTTVENTTKTTDINTEQD